MINAEKIYKEMISDFEIPANANHPHLSRTILLPNKVRIIFIVTAAHKQRMIAVALPAKYSGVPFPKWKGIEFKVGSIAAYEPSGSTTEYVIITQSKESDSAIFEIIANDITCQMEKMANNFRTVECLHRTLNKWKKFFLLSNEAVLSESLQMGLYGELLVLKKLIIEYGDEAVNFWSGAERETHDFYIHGCAVEVKTTAVKSSEKIKISSEHQLNSKDVQKQLFLYVNMIRKSHSDGETLPEIVDKIHVILSDEKRALFDEKLLYYGYIHAFRDKYTTGYFLRSKTLYEVSENFPNIIPDDLDCGVSEVSYSLDLNVCGDYQTTWENVVETINAG